MTGSLVPPWVLAAGGLVVFVLGALRGRRPGPSSQLLFAVALGAAVGAGVAAVFPVPGSAGTWSFLDSGPYGRFFTALLCGVTALTLLFAKAYAERRDFAGDELYGLVLWGCLGMVLTASATHWLALFLGYELLSLCLYVLIALRRAGALSGEAALKYFFPGAVTSAFLVFGIALLYASEGTLDMAGTVAFARPWVLLGLSCVVVGLAFKLSFVPFHLWAADVYEGAPAPVTAFLASGSKLAVFAALLRLAVVSGAEVRAAAAPALGVIALLTVVVGNVGALTQPNAKRLLAYSSIAQMGYLLLALLGVRAGGAAAAVFYGSVYALMDLGAFGVVGALSPAERAEDLGALDELRGLGHARPWPAAALVVCLVSLAGLPPTGGFVGKVAVFLAVFRAGFPVLGLLALLATVPAAFLYLRLAVAVYRPADAVTGAPISAPRAHPSEVLASGVVVVLLLGLGLAPSAWLSAIGAALAALPPGP